MKKKVLGLMMGVLAAMPAFVSADEVGNETFKECVTSAETKTCTLTENVTVEEQLEISGTIVLDLNGYSITPAETTEIAGGLLNVLHGGTLTIEDAKGTGKITVGDNTNVMSPLQLTKSGKTDVTKTATLIVNGGHLEGNSFAICGNGNPDRINTKVIINGGKLSIKSKTGAAIYQPQDGETIINGGEITGATGIEIRSGKLEVNGGKIVGTEVPVTVTPNGNGTTSTGAGIAVAQHTTKLPIEIIINGGTIQGYSALYQSNPQNNAAEDIAKIKITVKGGSLEAINDGTQVIYSENNLITVEAGEFNGELSEDITTPEGTEVYEVITTEGEVKYVVAEEEAVEEGYFGLGFTEEGFEEVFDSQEDYEEVKGLIDETLEKKYTAAIYYEIVYGGLLNGNLVNDESLAKTELEEAVEVTLDIPETLDKVKEGFTRKYVVIRVHYNEETQEYETDVLPATEKDGKVTFETDKFSTYVLAYEDTKVTENPKTFDGISLYMIIAATSLMGLVSLVVYSKKAKNY